ncbi:hypothetical protein GWK48_11095 [Metallosphaera tengchongensis]|uniref:CopG family transcriptional regulator n=1 Tax=Metallosphaera tengchongensis TaxID=1532350 RepID=A0A6N0NVK2_9CREN|nr:hypothetical protein [Metallosphaera tengchongensis]QKR00856.1 hypothetical protein GWK48_11095 [Metallosphaera tengchongensis]
MSQVELISIHVNVKGYEEAAEKINYLFKSPDTLDGMREELKTLAHELSWDNHARKIREELENVGML